MQAISNRLMVGGFFCAALAGLVAGVALARAPIMLVINGGTPVSTSTTSIKGVTYVPVKDVAKALNMTAVVSNGKINISPAGGANQSANKNVGKIGEEIFTGKYRFMVNSVQEAQTYDMKYANSRIFTKNIKAGEGEKLIIVDCRLKNGTAKQDEFVVSGTGDYAGITSLADTDEGSHTTDIMDVSPDEGAPYGAKLLPGAALRFAMVFKVNKSIQPKDLVFSIVRYDDRSDADTKRTDVRIHLTP
ncbi:MAG: hypothetical protein H7Y38_18275 [Armatimonadetes bacterium]|nr:hypothetical protein [Armatimonadota bacterium]